MPTSESKIPISIYQIDKSEFGNTDCIEIAEIIIFNTNKNREHGERFAEQKVIRNDLEDFRVKIYHAVNSGLPKWSGFFTNVVSKKSRIFQYVNVECSYITFIAYKNELYACSGGQGNFALERYAVQNFGMEILVRLIEKKENVIKKLKDRGVTGSVLGQIRLFRRDQRFSDEDQFGKVYREVDAELNKKILVDIFGFKESNLKRPTSGCLAKDSFKINKRIGFDTLLSIVSKIDKIFELERNFSLNKIIQISKRSVHGRDLISKLEDKFKSVLFEAYKDGEISGFDFFHKRFEDYYRASSYTVKSRSEVLFESSRYINLTDLIYALTRANRLIDDDLVTFRISFLDLMIETYDDIGNNLTHGSLLDHLHGEISVDEKTYFRIDGEWYFVQEDFVNDLNRDCKDCIEQLWDEQILLKQFDIKKREREFSFQYLNQPSFIVLDTVTYENIEFCDLIKYERESISIIHVKKGFNNSLRELTNQISISARRFAEDKKAGFAFVDNIEAKAKKAKNDHNVFTQKIAQQNFPKEGLRSVLQMKDAQTFFCLAFVDTNKTKKSIKDDIKLYKSNIAKYCILELRSYIQSLNFGLKIIQIKSFDDAK